MMTAATGATLMQRTIWAKRRSQSFFEECINNWDADEWKRNFRVSRATFLCLELTPYLQRSSIVRKSLSVEKRVAITLWRLGTNIEYCSLSHLFDVGLSPVSVAVSDVCSAIVEHLASRYIAIPAGTNIEYCSLSHLIDVGLSTVSVAVSDVCSAIVEHLASLYIAIPAGEHLKLVVDGLMPKWGVPQCIGAIDSTHPNHCTKGQPMGLLQSKRVPLGGVAGTC